jgi:MmyB-like transcription regulator ligand binding domain
LVADLRLTAARYPADQRLKQLARDLAAQSPRFVELWEAGAPEAHQDYGRHKVIDHPTSAASRWNATRSSSPPTTSATRSTPPNLTPKTPSASPSIVFGTQAFID